jgi:hypothetical protein
MDWGYVTGYFDGEGTVWIGKPKARKTTRCSLSWANSHKESLDAIQAFIGCGSVKPHGNKTRSPHHKPMYDLTVTRRVDMIRVAEAMLPYSIIKKEQLVIALDHFSRMSDRTPSWGRLAQAGPEEVRRLYWDEELNLEDIGKIYGVTFKSVFNYMRRHEIPHRTRSEAMALAKWDSPAMKQRSESLRQRRISDWQDPAYRERMVAAIRAGQAKRIASLQAHRSEVAEAY